MSFKKIIVSGGIGAFLLFTGCQQASVNPISQIDDSSNTPEQSIEAVKLENPYTTEAMLRARDSLEAQGVLSKSKIPDDYFQPTHYYIRFKPQSIEEYLSINQKSNLVLWDFPLDYRFKAGLTHYRDSEIPAGKPNYLYTAVKVNQELPSKNYEILARLILALNPEMMHLQKELNFSTTITF